MTFEERLDPALLETYLASPDIDLGRDIPKLRLLIELLNKGAGHAVPVAATDECVGIARGVGKAAANG